MMKERLPKEVFRSLKKTIETGSKMDASVASVVASAIKDWAIEKGATHYAHVFYPLTGLTAEKHDSFLVPDGQGGAIVEFSGGALIQGEPDASSFPSGGIRATLKPAATPLGTLPARPTFSKIPTAPRSAFPPRSCRGQGKALDKKTPVLRSMKALNTQAQRILKLFGHKDAAMVTATAG